MAKIKKNHIDVKRLERVVGAGGGPEACIKLLKAYQRDDYDVLGGVEVWLVLQSDEEGDQEQTIGIVQSEEDAKQFALQTIYEEWIGGEDVPEDREEAFRAFASMTGRSFTFEPITIAETPVVVDKVAAPLDDEEE